MQVSHDVLKKEFAKAATPHHLGLAVSLTEQCNFRCTYCYESFELGAMPPDLYAGLRIFVEQKIPALRSFSLNWFGGEPLLEWKRMAEFTRHCRSLCEQHGVRMQHATTPTNAWALTPEIMAELVRAGVHEFMVSLDGDGEVHDKTRKLVSGRGTMERIYRNLLVLRATPEPFHLVLRLHLHADNLASQEDLVAKLARDFGADRRFHLRPITIGNFGGESVKSMRLLSKGMGQTIAAELRNKFRVEDPIETELAASHVEVCYAAKPNHIFIRPNGQVSKCTSALDRPDNDVGRLLPTGELVLDEQKALAWSFGFQTGEARDLTCPFFTKPHVHQIRIPPRGSATQHE